MATIKISELSSIYPLNSNTHNVSFVGTDTESGVSGRFTAHVLAHGLYANTELNVGNNAVIFPGIIGQFASNNETYLQVNLQNLNGNGSGDYVVTADSGTDTTHFIDLGIQGSNLEQGVLNPLDGYLLIQGDGNANPGANLVIGTLVGNRNIIFTQGGYEADNVVAKFIHNTGFHLVKKPITFADGTTQNTSFDGTATSANTGIAYAQSAGRYANAAFTQANTGTAYAQSAGSYANSAYGQANTATAYGTSAGNYANASFTQANTNATNIAAAGSYANSAFTKANNALANTSGAIFGGDLHITDDLYANGIIVFANSAYGATESLVVITAANNGTYQPAGGDGYVLHMTGKQDIPTRIIGDSFGANGQATFVTFGGRAARGNVTNPTALQTNDILTRFSGTSYGSTKYQTGGAARIDIVATENHTDSARGTAIKFYNILEGQNTVSHIATFNANSATFTGVVNPAKGFVYTPRVPSGNQTAITIDYSTDSIIKANCVADVTISHSNYTAGKIVDVWLTNNDNSNHTVTHGCAALRSTNKATTFTITSGSSAYMKFFSIDGDNANTFVTITA